MKPKVDNIEVGDEIFTDCGSYIVGEIFLDRGPNPMYLPEGGHEYTYFVPFENVIDVKKKE